MLGRIREFLRAPGEAVGRHGEQADDIKRLAAAALLVEAARLDGEFDDQERASVAEILQRHFQLDAEDASELIEAAVAEGKHGAPLHRFTTTVKNTYSPEERIEIIEMLWEVAYADGELHHYEANLLRRVGGLIYVSDRDRGDARKRVLRRLGLDEASRQAE